MYWLKIKDENFNIDEYLYIINDFLENDIEYYRKTNEHFGLMMQQAEIIELAKLKKFGAGDRLNASIVKQILINKYGWI